MSAYIKALQSRLIRLYSQYDQAVLEHISVDELNELTDEIQYVKTLLHIQNKKGV